MLELELEPVSRRRGVRIGALLAAWVASAPIVGGAQDVADIDYAHLSFRGLAVEFGRVVPDRVEETTSLGLRVDLGYAGTGLRVTPSVSYWTSRLNADEISEFQGRVRDLVAAQNGGTLPALDLGTIDYTDLSFGLDVHVVWAVPFNLLTFGGLGAGVHVIDGDGTVIRGTFVEDLFDSVDPAFNLHAGVEYPVTRMMRIYAVGRYELMPDLRSYQLRAGWQLMLGPNAPGEFRGNE